MTISGQELTHLVKNDVTLRAIEEHISDWHEIAWDRMESHDTTGSVEAAQERIDHYEEAYDAILRHRIQYGVIREAE